MHFRNLGTIFAWIFVAHSTTSYCLDIPFRSETNLQSEPHFRLSAGASTSVYRTTSFTEFQAGLSGKAKIGPISGHLEALGGVGIQRNGTAFLLEVPEGSFGISTGNEKLSLIVGRHKTVWSELDLSWQMGIWQPRNRWDYLNTIDVGLIGGFLKYQSPIVTTEIFASPIFLPEASTPSTLANGTFTSVSPWFSSPVSQYKIGSSLIPAQYRMADFSAMELISKPSASARIRLGESSGPFLQISGAYKPMNQILVAYDGIVRIPFPNPDFIDVTLRPFVGYQRLVGVDGGILNWNHISQRFSILSEASVLPPISDTFTYQQAGNATTYATETQWAFNEEDSGKLSVGYLRSFGGNASDRGPLAEPGRSNFEGRYVWSSAVRLGVETGLGFARLSSVFFESNVTYDFIDQMEVFRLKLSVKPNSNFTLMVGTDLLGSQLPSDVNSQTWIRSFSFNDRVYGGVTYVF